MARLTAAQRNALSSKSFALPEKRAYPVEDKSHAQAALRLAHNASPAEQTRIRAKVHSMYPGVGSNRLHSLASMR